MRAPAASWKPPPSLSSLATVDHLMCGGWGAGFLESSRSGDSATATSCAPCWARRNPEQAGQTRCTAGGAEGGAAPRGLGPRCSRQTEAELVTRGRLRSKPKAGMRRSCFRKAARTGTEACARGVAGPRSRGPVNLGGSSKTRGGRGRKWVVNVRRGSDLIFSGVRTTGGFQVACAGSGDRRALALLQRQRRGREPGPPAEAAGGSPRSQTSGTAGKAGRTVHSGGGAS